MWFPAPIRGCNSRAETVVGFSAAGRRDLRDPRSSATTQTSLAAAPPAPLRIPLTLGVSYIAAQLVKNLNLERFQPVSRIPTPPGKIPCATPNSSSKSTKSSLGNPVRL